MYQAAESKVDLGRTLGNRYRVVEFLGEGGMGEVYRARDLTLDMDVAVKLLNEDLAADDMRVAYFRNEVKLARRVTHPNICRLHDIVQEDDMWFITMQYVVGESLAARLRRERTMPLHEVFDLLQQLCRGLAAAHAVGVIHRDLKPGNVLLESSTGRAIIADFGIATELSVLAQGPVDIAGTRGYMAPEHAAGQAIDERTDLYALGVLAHRMVTGALPPQTPTIMAGADVEPAPGELPPDIDPILAEFIRRCLAPNPEDRPASALQALALIEERNQEAEEPAPRRSRLPIALAALLTLGALAAVGVLTRSDTRTSAKATNPSAPAFLLSSLDGSSLPENQRWLGDALARRIANELTDAWDLEAAFVKASNASESAERIGVSGSLARNAQGEFEAEVLLSNGHSSIPARAHHDSLQPLAEMMAKAIALSTVAADRLEPSQETLASVGATSPESWRLWRRAQRASLMQQWTLSRELARRAIELDPGFPVAHFEEGWTHGRDDESARAPLLRAIELVESKPEIDMIWHRAAEYQTAVFARDAERVSKAQAAILATPLSARLTYYLTARTVMADYFSGRPEQTAPALELLAEQHPREAGAPKLLANYYLKLESEQAAKLALAHAERALALAPDDLGARADYGRALLRAGRRDEAVDQCSMIDAADPTEKRWALAGGERTNSLFDLHMPLGMLDEARQDARRMLTGNEIDRGHGEVMLASIDAYRGNVTSAHARRKTALALFRKSGITEFIAGDRFTRAQHLYDLGKFDESLAVLEESADIPLGGAGQILRLRARARTARRSKRETLLAEARSIASEALLESATKTLRQMEIASDAGAYDEVIELAQKLRAGDGRIAWLFHAGNAHEELGNTAEAERLFRLLAEHYDAWTEPHLSAVAWLRAGKLREAAGDIETAKTHYESFLRRYEQAPPTSPSVREAKARLRRLEDR